MAVELERIFLGRTKGKLRQTLREISQPGISDNFYPERHSMHIRTPDVITTRAWLARGDYIKCFVNPSSTNWNISRRETFTKTSAGFVRNTWLNRHRNTYFDNYPISFTFQAGNIMPSAAYNVNVNDTERILQLSQAPQVPPGLHNFYKFIALLNDRALGGTSANYHIIVHHSRVFPQIWIEGFFDPQSSLSFTESADNGNTVTWTATFMVARTVPEISNYKLLIGLYQDWLLTSGAISESVPLDLAKKVASDRAEIEKLFKDWGWGGMPTDGTSKKDPSRVMRSKGVSFAPVTAAQAASGEFAPNEAPSQFGNTVTVGQTSPVAGTRVITQKEVGSVNPYDNRTLIW